MSIMFYRKLQVEMISPVVWFESPPVCHPNVSLPSSGTCAGLYTPEMTQRIATLMTPGRVKVTRLEKIEYLFENYLVRVRQNLHVIVCIDTSGIFVLVLHMLPYYFDWKYLRS